MKVLLVNPPTPKKEVWVREGRCQQFDIWGAPFPPLTLAYIAGQIKNIARALIIDAGTEHLNMEDVLRRMADFSPELLIISCATPTIQNDLGLFASSVKKAAPQIKIAALGIHVSALPLETMKEFRAIDFVIMGEPEITAKELVEAIIGQKDYGVIAGLAFRENNEVIVNSERKLVEFLDDLAFPDWTGVDFSRYLMPILNKPFNLIAFARGCPFSCKFCAAGAYYGKKIRKRSPLKIIEEIKENINRGIYDFLFWTESATTDKEYLLQVLEEIKKENLHNKIRWVANSRVDFVDEEILKKMKEAGCWQIVYGLEFGNDEILKLAQKGGQATVAQGRAAVEEAVKVGLVVDGHFILGYPGENEQTLKDTIDFAVSLPLTFAHFYCATPFPGSSLYEESLVNGWIAEPDWCLVSQNTVNLKTETLAAQTVQKFTAAAYRQFYMRPQAVWRILKAGKNIYQFLNISKLGASFIFDILKK